MLNYVILGGLSLKGCTLKKLSFLNIKEDETRRCKFFKNGCQYVLTYANFVIYIYVYMYIYIYTHTHRHTYIHIHIHTHLLLSLISSIISLDLCTFGNMENLYVTACRYGTLTDIHLATMFLNVIIRSNTLPRNFILKFTLL